MDAAELCVRVGGDRKSWQYNEFDKPAKLVGFFIGRKEKGAVMAKREFVRFTSDDEVRELGERMMARTLPKARWTHAAHWATTLWLLTEKVEVLPERDLPGLIRSYNESVGRENTDTAGYHETITQASIRAARRFLRERAAKEPLYARCNALMETELGDPEWLLKFWDKETLFSVEARRGWVEPDKNSDKW